MKKLLIPTLVLALFLYGTTTQAANVSVYWLYDTVANILYPVPNATTAVVKANNYQASSTTQTNTFPLITATRATTTSLTVSGVANQPCIGTNANGDVQAGTCGGSATSTNYWNQFLSWLSPATSTDGIVVNGSSTISGLTMSRSTTTNATTTNLYISGSLTTASGTTLNNGGYMKRGNNNQIPIVISEMGANWGDFYGRGTIAFSSTIYKSGTSSLSITATNTGQTTGARYNIPDYDGSKDNYVFWVRSDNWSQVNTAEFLISTAGTFTDTYTVDLKNFLVAPPNNEWIEMVVPRTNFTRSSAASNWATVNDMIFRITSTNTPTVWVDRLSRVKQQNQPLLAVVFDDAWATQYTAAKPIMDAYAIPGTAYVIWNAIGTSQYMTEAQLADTADGGWDIGGHGAINLTTLTSAQVETDLQNMKLFLNQRGYRGAENYAFPNGAYNSSTLPIVRKYFATQRTIDSLANTSNYMNADRISAFSPSQFTSTSTLYARVDNAVANNDFIVITFHNIVDVPAVDTDFSTEKFRQFIAYVASSSIKTVTMSAAMNYDDSFVTKNDGSMAIGTSSPSSMLTIWGNTLQNTWFNIVNMASSTLFAVMSNGNVGIGTTSPSALLTVAGDMRLTGRFADSASSTGAVGSVLTATANGTQWLATSSLGISGGGAGTNFFSNSGLNTFLNTGTNLQAPSFQATSTTGVNTFAGRVGIGTTTPNGIVDIVGSSSNTNLTAFDPNRSLSVVNTDLTSGNVQGITLRSLSNNGTLQSGVKLLAVNTARSAAGLTSDLAILTNNDGTILEKMRVLSNGRIGVGTTSPAGIMDIWGISTSTDGVAFDPNRSLSVVNSNTTTGNMQGIALRSVSASGTLQSGVKLLAINTARSILGLTSDFGIFTNNNGTISEKMRVMSNGNVGIGSTTPGSLLSVQYSTTTLGTTPVFNVASTSGYQLFGILGNRQININNSRAIISDPANFNWFFGDCGTLTATGQFNTCVGRNALNSLAGGNANMAIGLGALSANTSGIENVGIGVNTLASNVNGQDNVAIGDSAGVGVGGNSFTNNTLLGAKSGRVLTTGSNNIFVGFGSASTSDIASNNICIGYNCTLASTTANSQLNLGGTIFGSNMGSSTGYKIGIGTSTPSDAFTVVVPNNAGIEVQSSNSGFIGYGKIGADRWRMQNDFTSAGTFEILYNNGAGAAAGTNLLTLTGTGSGIAGRVGVATTSPVSAFAVVGTTTTQNLRIYGLPGTRALFLDASGNATSTAASASLSSALSDETGTGVAVFNSSPTITTPLIASLIGGTLVGSTLTLKSTTAAGTSDAIIFVVGNNGATQAGRIWTNGNWTLGSTTASTTKLGIYGSATDIATSSLFRVATSTWSLFSIDGLGHIYGTTTSPVLSSCGTSPTIVGGDSWGTVTTGATANGCKITFATPFNSAPSCNVTNRSMSLVNAMTYTTASSSLTITQTAIGGALVDYHCFGMQ